MQSPNCLSCPQGTTSQLDPADLELRTEVNGEVKQDSRTSLMIHDVGAIVEWISAVMTLLPGDLILTGTPAGVGPIVDGDTVNIMGGKGVKSELLFQGISVLANSGGDVVLKMTDTQALRLDAEMGDGISLWLTLRPASGAKNTVKTGLVVNP